MRRTAPPFARGRPDGLRAHHADLLEARVSGRRPRSLSLRSLYGPEDISISGRRHQADRAENHEDAAGPGAETVSRRRSRTRRSRKIWIRHVI